MQVWPENRTPRTELRKFRAVGRRHQRAGKGFHQCKLCPPGTPCPPPRTRAHTGRPHPQRGERKRLPLPALPSPVASLRPLQEEILQLLVQMCIRVWSLGQGLSSLWLLAHSKMGRNSALSVVSGIKPRNSHVCAWQVFCYIAQPWDNVFRSQAHVSC